MPPADLCVVVPTRNRPERLAGVLRALRAQTSPRFEVIVVDQGDGADDTRTADGWPRVEWVRDPGRGLSRARNLGWRRASAEWIAFLDDDCEPAADWVERAREFVARHPDADCVAGEMTEGRRVVFAVPAPRRLSGRRVRPWDVAFGGCTLVRRDALARLGGWDERLGAGTRDFPAAEDMDLNYRLMRAGGVAYHVPELRVDHRERRAPESLAGLYGRYSAGWAGFTVKHLRTGDLRGGAWLAWLGLRDALAALWSAARGRSRSQARVAARKVGGLAVGGARAVTRRW